MFMLKGPFRIYDLGGGGGFDLYGRSINSTPPLNRRPDFNIFVSNLCNPPKFSVRNLVSPIENLHPPSHKF